jgi:DNA (cytosine-5)-methyltransferase 1
MITTGSDFSGVGAFDQALERLGIKQNKIFACDMDKYARQTYIYNFGEPAYYPKNVYDREIPKKSLDIYMTSPPCQSFSLAGKRKGEDSTNGVLFYNSHEFITKNKPRYFIFENVKGLLSDDGGKTFQRWIDYLGGKSVNGNPVIFPLDEATPYHVYYQVLNAKHYGIPQNRERIFIIGIRDDADNKFSFPKPFHLVKRLKDVLESEVDEKYFLSDKMIAGFIKHSDNCKQKVSGFKFEPKKIESIGNCITARCFKMGIDDNYIVEAKIGAIRGRNPNNPLSRVSGFPTEQMLEINENGTSNALTTVQKDNVVVYSNEVIQLNASTESGGKQPYQQNRVYDTRGVMTTLDTDSGKKSILVTTNNSKGYDKAEEEEDSINFSVPNSETRRGRIGKGVSQTLDTQCNQGIATRQLSKQQNESKKSDVFEIRNDVGIRYFEGNVCGTIRTIDSGVDKHTINNQRIRRLTPRECFRLMDFSETFKWDVSDSQAYKQAGNSICVGVLFEIIKKLKFKKL